MKIIKILVLILIVILVVNFIFINTHKITITEGLIKYNMTGSDKSLISKYSEVKDIKEVNSECLFYTTVPWKSSSGNYIHSSNDHYFIIEPGYYYYLGPSDKIEVVCNGPVNVFNVLKNKNKINFV